MVPPQLEKYSSLQIQKGKKEGQKKKKKNGERHKVKGKETTRCEVLMSQRVWQGRAEARGGEWEWSKAAHHRISNFSF